MSFPEPVFFYQGSNPDPDNFNPDPQPYSIAKTTDRSNTDIGSTMIPISNR